MPKTGDWITIILSIIFVIFLFKTQWTNQAATKILIRNGAQVSTYSLNQNRTLMIHGKIGDTEIVIEQGKARFKKSPCNSQYCVHQGWLTRAGQIAICLPNQVSLELLGAKKTYDSLNY